MMNFWLQIASVAPLALYYEILAHNGLVKSREPNHMVGEKTPADDLAVLWIRMTR